MRHQREAAGSNLDRAIDRAAATLDRLDATAARTHVQYADDPVGFVRHVLRGESARRRSNGERYQFTWLRSVNQHDQSAFRTGHGVGKSTFLAWAALWWLCTRLESLTIILAPTSNRQARGIVQREMGNWARRSDLRLHSDGVFLNHGPTGSRVVLLSGAADIGAIEGQHAPSVLLLADEAKSLTRDTLDAVAGALTGEEARTVLASTPGAPSGPFYDACTSDDDAWAVHHVGSADSDRVATRWVEGRKRAWGEASSTYRMRVAGKFPEDGVGCLFPWGLLHAARTVNVPDRPALRGCSMGVDVARSVAGDASAVCVVHNGKVIALETWRSPDSMKTLERVVTMVVRYTPGSIRVDASGPGGGVVDRLRELGYDVEAVYFGGRAREPQRFANWRADAFHQLRDRMDRSELQLPDDDRLLEELAETHTMIDRSGRMAIIPKEQIRAALGRSPDMADALALAIAGDDPAAWHEPPAEALHTGALVVGNAAFWQSPAGVARRLGFARAGDPLTWSDPLVTTEEVGHGG